MATSPEDSQNGKDNLRAEYDFRELRAVTRGKYAERYATSMTFEDVLADSSSSWTRCPPASEADIQRLLQRTGLELPPAYLTTIRYSNGGDGEFCLPPYGAFSPGWFQLWPISEVLEANDRHYIHDGLMGYFAFAGNGGGEFFAFDTRTPHPWRIVMFPYLHSGEEDGIVIAMSFEEFVTGMGRSSDDDKS